MRCGPDWASPAGCSPVDTWTTFLLLGAVALKSRSYWRERYHQSRPTPWPRSAGTSGAAETDVLDGESGRVHEPPVGSGSFGAVHENGMAGNEVSFSAEDGVVPPSELLLCRRETRHRTRHGYIYRHRQRCSATDARRSNARRAIELRFQRSSHVNLTDRGSRRPAAPQARVTDLVHRGDRLEWRSAGNAIKLSRCAGQAWPRSA